MSLILRCRFDPDHMQLVTDERSRPAWRMIAAWVKGRAQGA